jgi:hypothetical protein
LASASRRKNPYSFLGIGTGAERMSSTVFAEVYFWLLVACSLVVPVGVYGVLLAKRAVSRITVLILGSALVAIAGVDVYLMQHLKTMSKLSPSLLDDAVFNSEVTIALYLLPALCAGVGINVMSDVLIRHLGQAQEKFRREHPDA